MIVAALVPLSLAAAATLGGLTSTKVGSGQAAIAPCDTDGFTPTYTTSGGSITSVTVSGIADPRCEGTILKLTVVDSSGTSIASGGPQTIPTDGDTIDNSMTVSVNPQPAAASAAGVHISVVEP
jgi:hypothetical protein